MPIESPQLDDLRFQAVADQLRRQIPLYAPDWTDHNESDPGITMIQLFAHLAEQIGYRLNRLPDKAYIEMLKLIGVRLRPAEAASTLLCFYLGKPELATSVSVPAGARIKAKVKQGTPPTFETLIAIDAVPGQVAALVTTQSGNLRDISEGTTAAGPTTRAADYIPSRYSLTWDGRQPKLKDWPEQPIAMFGRPTEVDHDHLWIGLAFNRSPSAGFVGQRLTLTVQLDHDELPDPLALADCSREDPTIAEASGPAVEYIYYRPAQPDELHGNWLALSVIGDSTAGWTQSGSIRLDNPTGIGPIPDDEWVEVRTEAPLSTAAMCAAVSAGTSTAPVARIDHPLIGALRSPVAGTPTKVPVSGWIGVRFLDPARRFAVRAITFNAAPAIAATTAENELIARGTGHSDQVVRLINGNVLSDTLELLVQDVVDQQYYRWTRVDDFDRSGRDDLHYVLDPEAGRIYFGDGIHGSLPGVGVRIVAARYRHGGGAAAELPVGTVTQGENLPAAIQDVTNVMPARGGKDAETLDEAKRRAPRELKTLGRAVTSDDFELLTTQTPGVRISRAIVIPLRRPYQAEGIARAGIDVDRVAPGAVSLIAVPQGDGPYLVPTEGMLRTVCRHLDRYRLVTTELYVVAPQYVRLFELEVRVVPEPGWSRTQLRESIAARLETYFHVLRGGPDGTGFDFGGTVHHAELMSQVFRADGVARVEHLSARYDSNAPAAPGQDPPMRWRDERRTPRDLVACPEGPDQMITLFPDETVFVDDSTLNVIVLA